MFGTLGRRAAETVIVLFALLGFGFVPLGSKTAFEHTLALLRTAPAREAAAGFVAALERGRALLGRALVARAPEGTKPLPLPSGSAVVPGAPRLSSDPAPRRR